MRVLIVYPHPVQSSSNERLARFRARTLDAMAHLA